MIKLLDQLRAQRLADRHQQQRNQLIRREAAIGGELFGPVPKRGSRTFFNLNHSTWIWHEEWIAKDGQRRIATTRYEIRPAECSKLRWTQLSIYRRPRGA